MIRLAAPLALAALAVAGPVAARGADEPVRISVDAPPVAPARLPVPIAVALSADPGTLDATDAPLRLRVRLAATICGASFDTTDGTPLLDRELRPAPLAGRAYSATMRAQPVLSAFGSFTACAFLEESGTNRLFGFDATTVLDVSQRCTSASLRRVAVGRQIASRRRALRRAHARRQRVRIRRQLARLTRSRRAADAAVRRACR